MSLASLGRIWLVAVSLLFPAAATVVGLGTIEQPVNLGRHSDPASIPLGPVAYESNHGYGIHALISASRPCQHGAMELEKGRELEQNLACAFGISVEPVEPTLVPYSPVVLRVKAWPKPAYSPYSREQVLAATLQCLVRSTGGTPKMPLVVQVVTEDPADQAWAAKYAGKYITRPDQHGEPFEPTPVPGTKIETDAFGVARVVFSGSSGKPVLEPRPPVWIPFRLGGESGPDEPTWKLLPVWTGDDWAEPFDALGRPYTLIYDLFNPASSSSPQAHALFRRGHSKHWNVTREAGRTSVLLSFDDVSEGDMAAFLHALILSVRPTAELPLEVTLRPYLSPPPYFENLLKAGGWEETQVGSGAALQAVFVLDPQTGKLGRGTLPRHRLEGHGSGSLRVVGPQEEDDTGDLPKQVHESYQWHFMNGMRAKAFEPTDEEIRQGLGEARPGSMRWEFWHAGYRDAVLEFLDPARLNAENFVPADEPDNELSRYRQNGRQAGHRRGQEIGTRLLKQQQAALENAEPER